MAVVLTAALPAAADSAAAELRRAARAGDGAAMMALGEFYATGNAGGARDAATAHLWFSRAADQGMAGAEPRRLEMLSRLGLDQPGECRRQSGGQTVPTDLNRQAAKGSSSRGQ